MVCPGISLCYTALSDSSAAGSLIGCLAVRLVKSQVEAVALSLAVLNLTLIVRCVPLAVMHHSDRLLDLVRTITRSHRRATAPGFASILIIRYCTWGSRVNFPTLVPANKDPLVGNGTVFESSSLQLRPGVYDCTLSTTILRHRRALSFNLLRTNSKS